MYVSFSLCAVNNLKVMKRRRETELTASEIRSAVQELSALAAVNGGDDGRNQPSTAERHVPLKPFLSICSLLIQVLG